MDTLQTIRDGLANPDRSIANQTLRSLQDPDLNDLIPAVYREVVDRVARGHGCDTLTNHLAAASLGLAYAKTVPVLLDESGGQDVAKARAATTVLLNMVDNLNGTVFFTTELDRRFRETMRFVTGSDDPELRMLANQALDTLDGGL